MAGGRDISGEEQEANEKLRAGEDGKCFENRDNHALGVWSVA